MAQMIHVRGASENNLKHVDIDIPKGKLVVFAGVSGSGKSSLVFDTIAAEAGRQLRETFPLYVRNRMPQYHMPNAEGIENLSAPIVVNQRIQTGNIRSTVGTLTDTAPMIRLMFSRCAQPSAGTSNAYSFNDPQGMCLTCSGLGYVAEFDINRVLDRTKSLNEGAICFPGHQVGACLWQVYANSGLYDPDKPLQEYTDKEWNDFLHGSGITVTIRNTTGKVWGSSYQQTYEGFQDRLERLYLKRDINSLGKANRIAVENMTVQKLCPCCQGKRLNETALNSKLFGYNIADLGHLEINDVIRMLKQMQEPAGYELAQRIITVLQGISDMGLGYLNLDRPTGTLSGGELQRLKMVRHLGSSLNDMMYIFDEPSIGLHPCDVERLKHLLLQLRDRGNTVLVVEHNRSIMEIADQIIELGPMAGKNGGKITFQGTIEQLKQANTVTAQCLRTPLTLKSPVKTSSHFLHIKNANLHNLKHVSVSIPVNCLTAVTGVAGSGKSSLVCGALQQQFPQAVQISQSPIGTSSRSTLATYTGILDEVRKLMAKKNHVSANLFSFNSKGACPACSGKGVISVDMAFMDAIEIPCETCEGKRYNKQALSYQYQGKNILDILNMTVEEATPFFANSYLISQKLAQLQDVGLGYITLGQPTSTLSGGECQRVKLASRLCEKSHIYVMDEPTTGLHSRDVELLIKLLHQIVNRGNTVIVVEHNQNVIAQSDWVIDMGLGGGKDGGSVVFQGTPQELLQCSNSVTAEYLRRTMRNPILRTR